MYSSATTRADLSAVVMRGDDEIMMVTHHLLPECKLSRTSSAVSQAELCFIGFAKEFHVEIAYLQECLRRFFLALSLLDARSPPARGFERRFATSQSARVAAALAGLATLRRVPLAASADLIASRQDYERHNCEMAISIRTAPVIPSA
jgi:hypothetical protein